MPTDDFEFQTIDSWARQVQASLGKWGEIREPEFHVIGALCVAAGLAVGGGSACFCCLADVLRAQFVFGVVLSGAWFRVCLIAWCLWFSSVL